MKKDAYKIVLACLFFLARPTCTIAVTHRAYHTDLYMLHVSGIGPGVIAAIVICKLLEVALHITDFDLAVRGDFYPCDAMVARVLAMGLCLCVYLSHAGIVSKRLHGLSGFFAYRFPQLMLHCVLWKLL